MASLKRFIEFVRINYNLDLARKTIQVEQLEHLMDAFGHLAPLQQVKEGIATEDVECKSGLELIFKATNGNPACVSPASAIKLVSMGWART